MTTTIFRLLVLVPGALLLAVIGWLGLGFAGLSLPSVAGAVLLISAPIALIAWTVFDHRKRARARNDKVTAELTGAAK